MAELDQETHKMIVETHTMMGVLVKSHDEHKAVMNARLRDAKKELSDHKKEVAKSFEAHDQRIEKGEHFRTRIMSYTAVLAGVGAIIIEITVGIGKKFFGA